MSRNQKRPTPRRRAAEPASRARPKKRTRASAPSPPPAASPRVAPAAQPVETHPAVAATPPAVEAPPASPPAAETVLISTPEVAFAARAVPPEPDRPYPVVRRAIFFDVENTSRAEHIARVINHLAVDRRGQRTEFVAVGNWKVIGHDTARLLAHHGAQLVHSAPSTGVRDWSDLRIAVSAGVWLGTARAGDMIEIVSDDRAFDAVGDVSSGLGVTFRRLSYRSLAGVALEAPAATEPAVGDARGRRRRRGRRYGGRRETPAPFVPATPASPRPVVPEFQPAAPSGNGAEPEPAHTAPQDEIISVIHDLIERSATGTVSIDTLANTLKARGFRRTPGSPRLITRLRRIRGVELSSTGAIRLSAAAPAAEPLDAEESPEPVEPARTPPAPSPLIDVHDEGDERQPDVSPTGEPLGPVETAAPRGGRRRRGGRGRYRGSSRRVPAAS